MGSLFLGGQKYGFEKKFQGQKRAKVLQIATGRPSFAVLNHRYSSA
jgi:hypothetical protein